MKIKTISLFSTAAIILLMVPNNSKSSVNFKICKHNGVPYDIIPINQRCVHAHSSTHTSSNSFLKTPINATDRTPNNFVINRETHICVLTEEPLSSL